MTDVPDLSRIVMILVAGVAFCAGTACYYAPNWRPGPLVAAVLYTTGASLFLILDLYDWRQACQPPARACRHSVDQEQARAGGAERANRALSVLGTALYVLGSVAYTPVVYAAVPAVGNWSYAIGSVFVGSSQLWKARRATIAAPKLTGEAIADIGAELSAALGAWCWLIGALIFASGAHATAASLYWASLGVWMAGSLLFTAVGFIAACRPALARVVNACRSPARLKPEGGAHAGRRSCRPVRSRCDALRVADVERCSGESACRTDSCPATAAMLVAAGCPALCKAP